MSKFHLLKIRLTIPKQTHQTLLMLDRFYLLPSSTSSSIFVCNSPAHNRHLHIVRRSVGFIFRSNNWKYRFHWIGMRFKIDTTEPNGRSIKLLVNFIGHVIYIHGFQSEEKPLRFFRILWEILLQMHRLICTNAVFNPHFGVVSIVSESIYNRNIPCNTVLWKWQRKPIGFNSV